MSNEQYNNNVYINCPFDNQYKPLFNAVIFTVFDCGFRARCALEACDASEVRADKIFRLIAECKYGIHDISRTEPDSKTKLPRFNMPLELGYFLAAKKYGDTKQKEKKCLILDKDKYRYQKFISDLAGQDIEAHDGNVTSVIRVVRNWIKDSSGRKTIPGGSIISDRYTRFKADLPAICKELNTTTGDLTFCDYSEAVAAWLEENTTHRT